MVYTDIRKVLPSQYVVDAMDRLPTCGPDSADEPLEIEVPLDGCFRVTFQPRKQARRGWPVTWIWIPSRAERIKSEQEHR